MRNFIVLVVSLILVGSTAHAQTSWTNWGSAPYASNQEEAFELLPVALVELGIPAELHQEFMDMVSEDPDGEEIFLDPNDRLAAMMSGGANPHAMFDVLVAAIPVNQSGSIVQAARARKWEIEYEGVTYSLILPEICFNWSYLTYQVEVREVEVQVSAPPEECAILVFPAEEGWVVRNFFLSEENRLPASGCWALLEGLDNEDGARISALPAPCDRCDFEPYLRWARREHGVRGNPVSRVMYEAERGRIHAVIIPLSQMGNYNTVCVGPDERRSYYSPVTVEPTDWSQRETPFQIDMPQGRTILVTHQFNIGAENFEPLPRRNTWLWY